MMLFHFEPLDTVIQELESHPSAGLSSAQIPEKLSQFGENKLSEKKKKTNKRKEKTKGDKEKNIKT